MAVGNVLVTILRFVIGISICMRANKSCVVCLDSTQKSREVVRPINR